MSTRLLTALLFALPLAGCANSQLKYSTGRAASTLPDLQYRQVLDNLAMFVENPGSLPYFAVAGGGTVQVQDSAGTQDTLGWMHKHFPTSMFQLGPVQRFVSEQWTLATVTDPDKLKQLRCLYQKVTGQPFQDCFECDSLLNKAKVAQDDKCRDHPACWFQTGTRWQVPHDAAYVAHHGHTYVWVMPEGVDGLSRFTLAVLDVVTASGTPTQNLYLFRGTTSDAAANAAPEMLDGNRSRDLPNAPPTRPARMNFYNPFQGLSITPGAR